MIWFGLIWFFRIFKIPCFLFLLTVILFLGDAVKDLRSPLASITGLETFPLTLEVSNTATEKKQGRADVLFLNEETNKRKRKNEQRGKTTDKVEGRDISGLHTS